MITVRNRKVDRRTKNRNKGQNLEYRNPGKSNCLIVFTVQGKYNIVLGVLRLINKSFRVLRNYIK